MTPDRLPQAAPVGLPPKVSAPEMGPNRGIAAHGLARTGAGLSVRFGSTTAAPQRDHVLDHLIRATDGGFPQGGPASPGTAARFRDDERHEPAEPAGRQDRRGLKGGKSIASLVARLACGLFQQRRGVAASSTRAGADDTKIFRRRSPDFGSRGLDDSATTCRGSSRQPPEIVGGALPRDFY